MAKLHTVYQLTITTLSPLHIGTGNTLRRDYDYVTHRGKTWVINQSALAAMLYAQDPSEFERMAAGASAADLIRPDEFKEDSPLFRYVMAGEPRAHSRGAEIQEQIKDPWDRPYIPGSSLKGALRTAIAFVGAAQRQVQIGRASCRERGEVSVAGGAGKEEDGERTDGAADGGGGGCVTR